MAGIELTPFSFDEEDTNLVDIQELPAASQVASKEEKKTEETKAPTTETKQAPPKESVNMEEEFDSEDDLPVYDIFGQPLVKKEEKKEESTSPEDLIDYKQFAKHLIDKGIWDDFEDSDKVELNAESFVELTEAQAKRHLEKVEIEARESRDVTTNQLIDFVSSGGNINDLLSNIKEQRDIESISIDTTEGQEEAVRTYYESLDWDKKKIDKYINYIKDNDELSDEAKKSKEELVKVFQEERDSIVKEQQDIAKDRQLKADSFNKTLKSTIYSDKEVVDREKKEMEKFIFDYKYEDGTGNKYSEFGKQFLDIQQDPKKYYKFLKMIKNFDAYEEKTKTESKTKSEVFSFIKKNAETTSGLMGEIPQKETKKEKVLQPFRFNK